MGLLALSALVVCKGRISIPFYAAFRPCFGGRVAGQHLYLLRIVLHSIAQHRVLGNRCRLLT